MVVQWPPPVPSCIIIHRRALLLGLPCACMCLLLAGSWISSQEVLRNPGPANHSSRTIPISGFRLEDNTSSRDVDPHNISTISTGIPSLPRGSQQPIDRTVAKAPKFCFRPSLPFPERGGDLLVFVYDWVGYGRHYSQQALTSFLPTIDQCAGQGYPFKARFVHEATSRDKAHGIYYNGPQYLSRGKNSVLQTFNRNQKVVSVWHEQNVMNVFPHPYVDVEVSMRLDAEVPLPYGCGEVLWILHRVSKGVVQRPDPTTRKLGTAAFISNCAQAPERLRLLQALTRATKVYSYGRCEHNSDLPPSRDLPDWENRKTAILQRHRALLAWENIRQPSYVTEKIFHALSASVVPIYWGSDTIKDILPVGSYINANQYTEETIYRLAEKLERLNTDDQYYLSFFEALKYTRPRQA